MEDLPYGGLPDDLARLAVQRLMTCDARWRAYNRRALVWQRISGLISALSAVAASVAAVSFVQNLRWLAIALSVAVAVLVPLQSALGATGRLAEHREAGTKFELLAIEYEGYCQLELGPAWWRRQEGHTDQRMNLDPLRRRLESLESRMSQVAGSAPPIRLRPEELPATEARATHLVGYLSMSNVVVPERPVWAV